MTTIEKLFRQLRRLPIPAGVTVATEAEIRAYVEAFHQRDNVPPERDDG